MVGFSNQRKMIRSVVWLAILEIVFQAGLTIVLGFSLSQIIQGFILGRVFTF